MISTASSIDNNERPCEATFPATHAYCFRMYSSDQLYDELGEILANQGIEPALQQLDIICRDYPWHGGAWELRGLLESQAGRHNLAVRYFEQATELVPLESWSSRVMAISYIKIGRTALGIDLLQLLASSPQAGPGLIRIIIHDLINVGRAEIADEVVWTGLSRFSDNASLWHELSAIRSLLGYTPRQCLQAAQRAVMLAPEVAEYRVTMASVLIRMNLAREAYDVVACITDSGQVGLDCPCCLWRLICIFDCFDNPDAVTLCYERLSALCNRR